MNSQRHSYGMIEWMLVLILAVIWGSSFILMKRGLEVYTPSQVAALRMFSACVFLFPVVIGRINEIQPGQWKFLLSSAFLGNGIPALLFTLAQTQINSSVAGILNGLTPLFAMLIAVLFFKTKIARIHIVGILIGFGGAVSILLLRKGGSLSGNLEYGILIIIATAMYGASVNIIKNFLHDLKPLLISGFAVSISGIPYGIYLFSTDFTERVQSGGLAMSALVYVLILGVVGTAISLVLFNRLIKSTSVLFASSVTYLIPVVALCWGFADGEVMSTYQVFGLGAILTGVYLVNRH